MNHSKRALLTLALCTAALTPAYAVDPVCGQLRNAMQVLKAKPFHLFMNQSQQFGNAKLGAAAGQLGMGGAKQVEEISTGTDIYVLSGSQWIDMQTSFAAMTEDKDSDPDTKKALEESKCKALPDEVMYGQPSRVFSESNPGLGTESKIWISKATQLPVRADMTNDQGAMKMTSVSRYEYSGVQAPAHAVTMRERHKTDSAH